MKKSRFIGWKNVFSFSFVQTAKSKSFIQSTVIMGMIIFLAVLGVNVFSAINQKKDVKEEVVSIEGKEENAVKDDSKKVFASEVYFLDETGLHLSKDEIQEYIDKKYEGVKIKDASLSHEEMVSQMENENMDVAYLHVTLGSSGLEVIVYLPKVTDFREREAEQFGNRVKKYLKNWKDNYLALTKEQKEFLSADIITTVVGNEKQESMAEHFVKMYVPMFLCLILYLCVILYGQMVGQSVAIEKSSKVMELLLTSIRPLAIILGKVLGMISLALVQIILLFVLAFGGNAIGTMLAQKVNPDYSNIIITVLTECNLMTVFSPIRVILALVIFLIGFAFFCILAGLVGATVNRGEDLSSAMTVYNTLTVFGFMLAYFPSIITTFGNMGVLKTVAAICPFSAPFYLPGAILMDNISNGLLIASVVVLIIALILLIFVVSKVYEMVILYNGNKIGIKQIKLMLSKGNTEA